MQNFTFYNPTRILFGSGRIADLAREIPANARVLITYGGGSIVKAGTLAEVKAALAGFTVFEFAGIEPNPTYETVSAGHTGHTEAVRVLYDPAKVSYSQLVEYFWRHIDPTVKDRQFCDVGSQYRSGIYWQNDAERQAVEASRDALLKSGRFSTIHTELAAVSPFYLAEDYHQDYYKKNELRYNYYRLSCGRDARVKKLWE